MSYPGSPPSPQWYAVAAPTSDDAPLPGCSLPEAVGRFFTRYAMFHGRASKSEYWWVALTVGVIELALIALAIASGSETDSSGHASLSGGAIASIVVMILWMLATLLPSWALTARRLHDANMSGWMQLLGGIPFVGGFIMLALTLQGSNPAGARFDADGGASAGLGPMYWGVPYGRPPYGAQPYGAQPYGAGPTMPGPPAYGPEWPAGPGTDSP